MNERIRELAEQSMTDGYLGKAFDSEKFVELIKQAIYNDVKEELMDDDTINEEPDRVIRAYLKGCNGGMRIALCYIKNFGMEIEE